MAIEPGREVSVLKGARHIFQFLLEAATRGERTALATITEVAGGSPRAVGTHMAVAESGAYLGSFSGGCTEAAIVGEARRVITAGHAEIVRLGAGSRYIDIRLPCGGGLDILISPEPPMQTIEEAFAQLAGRAPIALQLGRDGSISLTSNASGLVTGWQGDTFLVRHDPDLKLLIIGHGAEPGALAKLALAYGAETIVLSPDSAGVAAALDLGAEARLLTAPSPPPGLADPFTAILFLLHDHDWEADLLAWALTQNAFFIGAMGSKATHARRMAGLRERGLSDKDCERIIGPVGLIPATRDPDTLALSVLSQVVSHQAATAPLP